MICPYCGEQMECGELKAYGHALYYTPDSEIDDTPVRLRPIRKEKDDPDRIMLDGPYATRFHNLTAPCCICRHCLKLIVSYC